MIDLPQAYREYKNRRLMPWHKALWRYYKNRDVNYHWIKKGDWLNYKTSDTLFIFGSGPSLNSISDEEWGIIGHHDSMGLNHAFLIGRPMTLFYLGYEPASNQTLERAFTRDLSSLYENTLWFVPKKIIYRFYHPRTTPEFFPANVKMALFDNLKAIFLECDRPFTEDDFQKSLIYRGVMCIGLYFADLLQYKNIVLLGVDLHTYKHFFDDYDVMKERKWYNEYMEKTTGGPLESMVPKDNKFRKMDEYYYSVNELYFKPKGVNLYVGNKNNMLSPRIPLYPEFE